MQVGQKTTLRLPVGVRHVVSGHRSFAGDLTNSGHGTFPYYWRKRAALYTQFLVLAQGF
jgi:hypothetical protein